MSKYEILTLDQLLAWLDKYSHKELHVHHTWMPDHATYFATAAASEDERALARQASFYVYHTKTKGWADIAQHVTLLPDGRFVTGRDFSVSPASITGHNTGAFAVEMIGNFDTGHDSFRGAQRVSMIGLARWFDQRGKYVRFHCENSTKTCPGSGIPKANFMEEVRGTDTAPAGGGGRAPTTTLRKGDKGEAVKQLQTNLQKLGYSPGVIDGVYGELTEEAVIALQRAAGITADGIAGPATMAAIAKMLAQTSSSGGGGNKIYKVQVGAFQDRKNAERLAADLRQKGYSTMIV
jgi:hypothetical protein